MDFLRRLLFLIRIRYILGFILYLFFIFFYIIINFPIIIRIFFQFFSFFSSRINYQKYKKNPSQKTSYNRINNEIGSLIIIYTSIRIYKTIIIFFLLILTNFHTNLPFFPFSFWIIDKKAVFTKFTFFFIFLALYTFIPMHGTYVKTFLTPTKSI